jgi:hypothetical protein
VGPRVGLDAVKKRNIPALPGNPDCPVGQDSSWSLHRLGYTGSGRQIRTISSITNRFGSKGSSSGFIVVCVPRGYRTLLKLN